MRIACISGRVSICPTFWRDVPVFVPPSYRHSPCRGMPVLPLFNVTLNRTVKRFYNYTKIGRFCPFRPGKLTLNSGMHMCIVFLLFQSTRTGSSSLTALFIGASKSRRNKLICCNIAPKHAIGRQIYFVKGAQLSPENLYPSVEEKSIRTPSAFGLSHFPKCRRWHWP